MNFSDPKWLIALWCVVPVGALMVFTAKRMRQRAAAFVSDAARRSEILGDIFTTRLAVKTIFATLAVAFIIVALARPRWGFEWSDVKRQGADIIVAIDLSKSMLAADIQPNRLERAKRELFDLLAMLKGDRIGIVAFAGSAFVQCPLTLDYDAVRMFLGLLSTDLIPVPGTAIKEAMMLAQRSFDEASPEDASGRAVILMTDGEDEAQNMEDVEALVNESQIKVFAMGFGTTAGAPIPEKGGGFKKDGNGNVVLSKLKSEALASLSSRSGGIYVKATSDDRDLTKIYLEGIRGKVEQKEFDAGRIKIWYERFQWPLALGFLLLLLDGIVPWMRRKKSVVATLLLSLVALTASEESYAQWGPWKGQKSFDEGDFEAAEKRFSEAAMTDPDSFQHRYNEGVAKYRQGQYKESAEAFEDAAAKGNPEQKARAMFNAGNAKAGAGDLEGASKSYLDSLESKPDNAKVQENLAFVKKLIEQQQKQQNQDNQNKDDKKKDSDQKDDQKNQQKNGDQQKQQDSKQKERQQNEDQKNNQQSEDRQASEDQKKQDEAKDKQKQDEQQAADDKKTEEEKKQPQPGEEQKDGEAAQEQKAAAEAGEPSDSMSKAQAMRLLESVDDKMEKYQYIPKKQDRKKKAGGQDW